MDSQTPAPASEQPFNTAPAVTSSPEPSAPQPSSPAVPPVPPTQTPSNPKSRRSLFLLALFIITVGAGLMAYWYMQAQTKKTAVTAAPEKTIAVTPRKIIVGTDPTYPPMEYLEKNILTGYDIDLANFIGKELGAQITFKNIVFDDLFPALEKKEIDMVISTVTVTEERRKKYDFSDPYLQGGQVILTKKDNATITSTADLKGKKIAVQKGTTIETEALKYTSDPLVIRYSDFVLATAALVKGDVDAIFVDLPGAKGIITANPTLKIAGDPFNQEYYAIVFRKGDPQIKEINDALTSLKSKGILADLKQQWLDP